MKSSIFIWLSFLVGELHTLFENSTKQANWIINEKVVMPIQWNVKFAEQEAQAILIALSIVYYKATKFNQTTAKAIVFYYILDLLFYFYNYKTYGYGWTYTLTLIAWILIYNYGRRNAAADRQGTLIETERERRCLSEGD